MGNNRSLEEVAPCLRIMTECVFFFNYRQSSITLKGGHHLFITFMKQT